LLSLATLKRGRGDFAGAQTLFEESLAHCRVASDRWGIGRSLIQLSQQARTAGDYNLAIALAEESLAIAREIGVQDSVLWGVSSLGQLHRLRGDFVRARAFLEEALRIAPQDFFPLYQLGLAAENEGDYGRATALFEEGLALTQHAPWHVSDWQLNLARVARKRGDRLGARQWYEEALVLARHDGKNQNTCLALYELAALDWSDNDLDRGYAHLMEGLRLAHQGRDQDVVAFGLLFAASYASETGALVRAIRLFGAADVIVPGYRFEWGRFERATFAQSLEAARLALGSDVAAFSWAEGQAMTTEQAITYALEYEHR
jgi:tetratricopeptide (TPR) repeat protein